MNSVRSVNLFRFFGFGKLGNPRSVLNVFFLNFQFSLSKNSNFVLTNYCLIMEPKTEFGLVVDPLLFQDLINLTYVAVTWTDIGELIMSTKNPSFVIYIVWILHIVSFSTRKGAKNIGKFQTRFDSIRWYFFTFEVIKINASIKAQKYIYHHLEWFFLVCTNFDSKWPIVNYLNLYQVSSNLDFEIDNINI